MSFYDADQSISDSKVNYHDYLFPVFFGALCGKESHRWSEAAAELGRSVLLRACRDIM